VADACEYTFRYLNAEGRFVAIVQADCTGTSEAVSKAVQYLAAEYDALEVSVHGEVVWRGLLEDAVRLARCG
jgi:hypothetical protein